jgi:hypothetical protein
MSFRSSSLVALFLLAGIATSAVAEEDAIKVSATAKAACMPDAVRYCRDAIPNVQNVLICFGQNREKISNRCRTVLASYGLQ